MMIREGAVNQLPAQRVRNESHRFAVTKRTSNYAHTTDFFKTPAAVNAVYLREVSHIHAAARSS